MTKADADRDPEHLLAHDQFVRGLARQLIADAHGAEDVAQQTWVAALQQPLPSTSRRGWLATVVRRLAGRQARAERRLAARQRAAAQTESVPSTAEIVAREAARSDVVRAVLELEEPYRAVVLLRFFEDLPPRAIARRLAVPVETVRTRLKRAMALLRSHLDQRTDGGRAAWCALLLPYAGKTAPLAATAAALHSTFTGALLMTTNAKLAALAVALGGALLVAVWSAMHAPEGGGTARAAGPDVAAESAQLAPAAKPTGDAAAAPPLQREDVQVAPSATTGSLLVHVVWDDGKAATGVLVELYRSFADPLFEQPRSHSDDTGSITFTDLAPGKVYPNALRGDMRGDWKDALIEAGKRTEATIKIEGGMNVRGIVVDGSDHPVAGAEVVLAGWGGGEAFVLAHSADDGTFYLRSVGTHSHIGARAKGHAPSPLRQFTGTVGAEATLKVVLDEDGATLGGVVLDDHERPVAGAAVKLGDDEQKNRTLPDGGRAMGPRAEVTRTDAQGRFHFPCVLPGKLPLAARAPGLAPWHGDVEAKVGRDNDVVVHLLRGATLAGKIVDEKGAIVVRADIELGDWSDFGHRRITSDAAGEFRCEGLAAGDLQVRADKDKVGKGETKVTLAAGETVHCEVVLGNGLVYRGRVLGDDDKPIEGVMAEAQPEHLPPGANWWGFSNTDKEGRFVLANCPAELVFSLTLRRKSTFPEFRLAGQKPDAEEHVLRLPKESWARIKGTVLGPDGSVLPSVHVSPYMTGGNGSPAETADKQGKFDLGPYPPGEYQLSVQADGYPAFHFGPRQLVGDEVWDVGELRFAPGGTLAVALVAETATLPATHLSIYNPAGTYLDRIETTNGQGSSGPLAPGSYLLQIEGADIAGAQLPFEIRVGVATRLDVRLLSGVKVAIEFALPSGESAPRGVPCVVSDADGKVVQRASAWGEGPPTLNCTLLPGTYSVAASMAPLHGSATFAVAPPGPVSVKVELRR